MMEAENDRIEKQESLTCEWEEVSYPKGDVYDTSCFNEYMLDGTPKNHQYVYCPGCGRRIVVVKDQH